MATASFHFNQSDLGSNGIQQITFRIVKNPTNQI